MKVPPKRKGNSPYYVDSAAGFSGLNESPSEKEGKYLFIKSEYPLREHSLNESPSEKEGKFFSGFGTNVSVRPQ